MGKPLRVLIVEDSEDDAIFLLLELRKGGYDVTFERVDTAPAMSEALDKQTWDIVIADYIMPHFSAPDALILLKAREIDLPFIVVSGKIGEDIAVATMKAGAHDYIMKNNLKRLVPAVERELRDVVERRERKRADEAIRRRLVFEKTVSNISSRFVGGSDINDAINASLADMGRFSGASRAYVFLMHEDGTIMDNTHEWCAEGVSPHIDSLKNLTKENFKWWLGKLVEGEVIHIEDVSQMPEEAQAERELLEAQGIRAILVLPLNIGGNLVGFLVGFVGLDNVVETWRWTEDDLALLRVASEIMGNALERKKFEESLWQSEHNYRVLFESTTDGMFVIDADTMKVVLANRAASKMYGFSSAEDVIGMNLVDFVYPDDQDGVINTILKDMLEEDLRSINEFRTKTKEGREIWISASCTRTEYQGQLAGLVSFRDVTQRKKVEEEKRRLEEQVHLSSRLAAVGELAAGVAHELNNPIAAIKGFAELIMARRDLDETMKSDVETIYKEAQRTSRITQNLLSFARRHEPEKRLISINEALAASIDLCAYQMSVSNIEVMVEFEPDLPETMADFFQMQQVFLNIVINASQAMLGAHGKGKLKVETQRVDGMIRVTFTDDGPGIPEENLKRIFDPFFTTKDVGKGTGLGLSICYGFVQAHGGYIYARSKLGEGATFVVELPVVSDG